MQPHSMNAYSIYHGSNGARTRQFYSILQRRGLVGTNLFRAQKCSKRAKKYGPYSGVGGKSYRELAYANKGESLKQLTEALQTHGEALGITFGWGRDEGEPYNKWVLYVDLPKLGQVSFHSAERYVGPDYLGEWDGKRMSEQRIIEFCQDLISV